MSGSALRWVHFIAVGGTGMGSLAGLLKARGLRVTGSDRVLYPPMSTALAQWEIPVHEGFDPAHLEDREGQGGHPDLVVIGNAVRAENPEARAALDRGLRCLSFSDALYELAIRGKHSVVVSGTHGKTTSTSLLAALLQATGREPGVLVGGISLDLGGSFREGGGEHFVVEGDEYDTAFFDKTPKFLHYHPESLLLTSVEFDHADIYRDLDHVKSAFRQLVASLPRDGVIVAAAVHPHVRDVLGEAPCEVVRYGVPAEGDPVELDRWAEAIEPLPEGAGTRFRIRAPGRRALEVRAPFYGLHNVENAVGVLALLERLGVAAEESAAALPGFRGVKRRQELRGEAGGVVVLDDFAHHPTAVRLTLGGLRSQYPDRRLVAVFEPRTNTSRRRIFQEDYAGSFGAADRVIVRRVPDEPVYSATGEEVELFSSDELAEALRGRGLAAEALGPVDEIVERLVGLCAPGDVVIVMSNGGFDGIWEKLLDALGRRARA